MKTTQTSLYKVQENMYMYSWASHNWFWFYFWMDEKVAGIFKPVATCTTPKPRQMWITFNLLLKCELSKSLECLNNINLYLSYSLRYVISPRLAKIQMLAISVHRQENRAKNEQNFPLLRDCIKHLPESFLIRQCTYIPHFQGTFYVWSCMFPKLADNYL